MIYQFSVFFSTKTMRTMTNDFGHRVRNWNCSKHAVLGIKVKSIIWGILNCTLGSQFWYVGELSISKVKVTKHNGDYITFCHSSTRQRNVVVFFVIVSINNSLFEPIIYDVGSSRDERRDIFVASLCIFFLNYTPIRSLETRRFWYVKTLKTTIAPPHDFNYTTV